MKYVKGCLRRMMSFNFVNIVFVVVIVEMRNIYKGHNELQYCMHCVHVYTVGGCPTIEKQFGTN